MFARQQCFNILHRNFMFAWQGRKCEVERSIEVSASLTVPVDVNTSFQLNQEVSASTQI